jgi:lysine 2,3-aminomutase
MPLTWKSLIRQSIFHTEDLPRHLMPAPQPVHHLAMQLNPYFLSLIQAADDPIGKQVIPDVAELDDACGPDDPLAEGVQSPVPGLIHRYPGRVAFMVSNRCALHCRFCMRKRNVFPGRAVDPATLASGIEYIRSHAAINEVILTGGDPLMLDDSALGRLLDRLAQISHVRLLRIHTRMPSALPQRITPSLVQRLSAFQPLYLNIHINHPREITAQCIEACARMAGAGIALGSQTVLLKGVNDDGAVLAELMQALLMIRVRPYYLHILDRVRGTAHFQVSPEKAVALVTSLRGRISGMAVPQLMLDLPGGGGKVALTPESVIRKSSDHWLIRNWQGKTFAYPLEP